MLKRIVMQLSGQVMALFTQASAYLTARLWKVVSNLRVSYILLFLSVASLFALIVSKLKQLTAKRITLVMSCKQEPINAKQIATQLGLQAQKIAAPIHPPVQQAQKQTQCHVERTKSGRFARKGTGHVQHHTRKQQAVDGMKRNEPVSQLQQPATSQRKKGR